MAGKHDYWRQDRFNFLIEKAGITLKDLSDAIGCSYQAICYYAAGRAVPGIRALAEISDYFGLSLDYLTGRISDEAAEKQEQGFGPYYMGLRRMDYEKGLRTGKIHLRVFGKPIAPWPYNLTDEILVKTEGNEDGTGFLLSEDQEAGLDKAISLLNEREQRMVYAHYRDGDTLAEIAEREGVHTERARQIIAKAVRKLRHPSRRNFLIYGVAGKNCLDSLKRERSKLSDEVLALRLERDGLAEEIGELSDRKQEREQKLQEIDTEKQTDSLEEMNLSVRSYNCLKRAGCNKLGDVLALVQDGRLMRVRNMGRKSAEEVTRVLREYGFDVGEGKLA